MFDTAIDSPASKGQAAHIGRVDVCAVLPKADGGQCARIHQLRVINENRLADLLLHRFDVLR